MGFYEELAGQYDQMTRFEERIEKETAWLQRWIERYGFQSALDVACGTGLHAIGLARLGIRVAGVDLSAAMLAQANLHAVAFGVQIPWIQASMQELRGHLQEKYEALLCLGNSLPHLLGQPELDAAIANFYDALSPGGRLIIQLLNYQRILAEQNRIVGIHRHEDTVFVRFYDFLPELVQFNVLTAHFQGATCTQTFHSTPLYPYRQDELEQALSKQGFAAFEYYGDMQFQPFAKQSSPNLVIVAAKRG